MTDLYLSDYVFVVGLNCFRLVWFIVVVIVADILSTERPSTGEWYFPMNNEY